MKLFLIAALATSAAAFAPVQSGRNSFALRSAGSAEIDAAMAASKEYGPASKEARVLWDIVEEICNLERSALNWRGRFSFYNLTTMVYHFYSLGAFSLSGF